MLYNKLIEQHLDDSREILLDGSRTFTFYQLHEAVLRHSAAFQSQGLKPGDRILVSDEDPVKLILALLTCIAGGYICVPLSHSLDTNSRMAVIQSCQPAMIIEDILPEAPPNGTPRTLREEETLVYILFTSGSTGEPKGVVASQKQILFCCDRIGRRLKIGDLDRILCALPLSFDYGMYQVFLAFFNCAVLFLDGSGIVQRIPYLLKRWDITIFPTIPTVAALLIQMNMLHAEDVPALRCITFTGEVLPVPLIKEIHRWLPVVRLIPMYGMTECKRVAVMPYGFEDKVLAGSCGLPLDDVTVRLEHIDAETGIGELIVEGDNVMEGYWGALEENSLPFFVNDVSGKRGLRTGDLFRIDNEGFLYFCARINDILKIRGHRVSGTWLEEQFCSCPGILSAAAIGIPNQVSGERTAVFVQISSDTPRGPILDWKKTLPGYLHDVQIVFTTSPLPRNQNGKTDRRALRRMLEEEL